jgi:hypothetical protein
VTAQLFSNVKKKCFIDLKHYKASEFCALLVLYVPIFYGILPEEHFHHLVHLSNAIYILYKAKIMQPEILHARHLINCFCRDFEALYGLRYQTTNFHNLTHLVDNVLDVGPLWTMDCFAYENASGRIVRMIHGTQHVEKQILRIVSTLQKLPLFQNEVSSVLPEGGQFLSKMLGTGEDTNETFVDTDICAIGELKKLACFDDIMPYLLAFLSFVPVHVCIKRYKRFKFKNSIYHCMSYSKPRKRNSYTVQFVTTNGDYLYGMILNGYDVVADGHSYQLVLVDLLTDLHDNLRGANHIKVIKKEDTHVKRMLLVSSIQRKCVWMDFDDVDVAFLSLLPNISQVS